MATKIEDAIEAARRSFLYFRDREGTRLIGEAGRWFERGEALLDEGKPAEAMDCLESAAYAINLHADPGFGKAVVLKG